MSAKEAMDIVRDSALWKILSVQERVEALLYAIEVAGCKSDLVDDACEDVIDSVGEVYAG